MVEVADLAPPPADSAAGEGFGEDPVYFCDACPLKGNADAFITGVMDRVYKVGLNRIGAVGALRDADGNFSKPVDLPFKRANDECGERLGRLGIENRAEYWPEEFPELQVDIDGVIKAVGKCKEPEISQTRLRKREVNHCPALVANMMSKRNRKDIEEQTTNVAPGAQE